MAALAWLLLVVLPVHGEVMAANVRASDASHLAITHSMHGVSMAPMAGIDGYAHAASAKSPTHADDCCGVGKRGLTGSCHCTATAGSAMAAVGMIELARLMPADVHLSPRRTAAPDVTDGPPLRPPAA